MRTKRRDHDRKKNHCGGNGANLTVPLDVEHAITDRCRRYEDKNGGKSPHEGAAGPAEKVSVTQHTGALVVVI